MSRDEVTGTYDIPAALQNAMTKHADKLIARAKDMPEPRFRDLDRTVIAGEPLRDLSWSVAERYADPEAEPDHLREALESAGRCLATHSRDWTTNGNDAWLWGLLCGWDDGELDNLAQHFDWSDPDVERLRDHRAAVAAITGDTQS